MRETVAGFPAERLVLRGQRTHAADRKAGIYFVVYIRLGVAGLDMDMPAKHRAFCFHV